MSDVEEFRVIQATDRQRKHLRAHAERSYEKGLMDRLVLFMTVDQLREAHEDQVLSGVILNQVEDDLVTVESPAEVIRPAAIIKPA